MRRPGYDDVKPLRELVSDDEVGDAVRFVAETAHRFGTLQARVDYLAYMIGHAEAVAGLYSDEKSADRRKWEARTASSYLKSVEEWHSANTELQTLKAKRQAAELKKEVWQTLHADARGSRI